MEYMRLHSHATAEIGRCATRPTLGPKRLRRRILPILFTYHNRIAANHIAPGDVRGKQS